MKTAAIRKKSLLVTKLSGAGNTFLLIDWRQPETRKSFKKVFGRSTRSSVAAFLCDPYRSVGADGLLFLEAPNKSESQIATLKWDFYNADGSRAEMCGNAARVVGLFENKFPLALLTRAGVVNVTQEKNAIFRVEMPPIKNFEPNLRVKVGSQWHDFDFINSGVPHAVVHVSKHRNLKQLTHIVDKLVEIVDSIRSLTQFKKSGTNVTFYVTKDGKTPRQTSTRIESLTYERGVTGFTQACGTGVVAAAYTLSHKREKPTKNVSVRTPGGRLEVHLDSQRPILVGPAIRTARIYLS
jgi:diaminopimelate epimerase